MLAGLAEDFTDQLRSAIGDQVMFGVVTGGIDQAHELDDALDAGQVAATGCLQGGDQVDGHAACGLLGVVGADVATQLADPYLAILLGQVAGEEDGIAGLCIHHIGCCRGGYFVRWRAGRSGRTRTI